MFGNLNIETLIIYIVSILVALTVHEFMHAYAGYKLGDTTADDEGRLTLNPLRHIDPIFTVALPILTLITIGAPVLAAKPVPFNPYNVRFGEFGAAIIAAAGPLSNLAMALLGAAAYSVVAAGSVLQDVLGIFVLLNIAVFVFNLIPIPPLDGSRVLYAFAPEPVQEFMQRLEPLGLFILIGLVFLTPFGQTIVNINRTLLQALIF